MVKILSQAGNSLADTYDVQGSIAGIDQLETRELPIVHEMAGTVFSERFSTRIIRSAPGDIAQSTIFGNITTDLPDTPCRLLGVAFIVDNAARLARLSLCVRNRIGGQEIPIWAWDETNSLLSRQNDDGTTADFDLLVGSGPNNMLPSFCGGQGQPEMADHLNLYGLTTAFGAGTVAVVGLYLLGFSQQEGISSRGLPIPGW